MGIRTDDMRRVVERELGSVATICPGGTPNLSPKGTIAVWDDEARERVRSIMVIAVERVLPVTSPAYDVGATEDELRRIHRERLLG